MCQVFNPSLSNSCAAYDPALVVAGFRRINSTRKIATKLYRRNWDQLGGWMRVFLLIILLNKLLKNTKPDGNQLTVNITNMNTTLFLTPSINNILTHYILEKLVPPSCGPGRRSPARVLPPLAGFLPIMLLDFVAGVLRSARHSPLQSPSGFLRWAPVPPASFFRLAPITHFHLLRRFAVVVAAIPAEIISQIQP